jgi:hypothetical protein
MAKGKEALAAEKRRNAALLEKQTELMIQIAELKTENGMLAKQVRDLEVQHDRALRTGTLLTERDDAIAAANGMRDELEMWKTRTIMFAEAMVTEENLKNVKLPMEAYGVISDLGLAPDILKRNREMRRHIATEAKFKKHERLVTDAITHTDKPRPRIREE